MVNSLLKEESYGASTVDMKTFAIGVEFIGTNYRGWQRQQEVLCVQEVIETVLSKVANENIEVVATGRTDAGVHAGNMIAHFTTTATRKSYNWMRGANSLLPDDIALRWIQLMPNDFHARFMANARRYRYITLNQPYRSAILRHQVTHVYEPLDISLMKRAVEDIVGQHNFTSFRAAACQSNQPIRNIHHAEIYQQGQFIVLDIQADGFLHHMVRNLMGALYEIGKGNIPVTSIAELIELQNRNMAPPTASADGLYFVNAYYPDKFQALLPDLPLTPIWLSF